MTYNYFNFKAIGEEYLITNDLGYSYLLQKEEFQALLQKKIQENSSLYQALSGRFFLMDRNREVFIQESARRLRDYKRYLSAGPQLHIFVVTNRCNLSCKYCQVGILGNDRKTGDMSIEIAQRSVDIALQSPAKHLTFEFQGGEPSLSMPIIKAIMDYTEKHKGEKLIEFSVVSNLTRISDEMIEFFATYPILVSTSIDGPEMVHNYNRNTEFVNQLSQIKGNINRIKKAYQEQGVQQDINAIMTTTAKSFDHVKGIIDEYRELGFHDIFIRPLTPFGNSRDNWLKIGYTPEAFLEYYRESMNYIVELNRVGIFFREFHALIFLRKIMKQESLNYMELRSPCGGAIGQIAYNYDGQIYTCDEGRMIAEKGDTSFCIGNVWDSTIADLVQSDITVATATASCLEIVPGCSDCVYSPYCGSCPVFNYVEQGTIFGEMAGNYKCKIYKGILDYIFELLKDEENVKIFESWLG
jgi:His-Xaa-Ser system radical SAM maturase HxsB